MKIAVLGAGGFIGSRFIQASQLWETVHVRALMRSAKSLARLSRFGVDFELLETGHLDSLTEALRGFSIVVNFASGDWTKINSDVELLYAACEAAKVDVLVQFSSAVVFGRAERIGISDDSAPDMRNWMLYARKKGEAETFLRSKMENSKPVIVVLRPGLVWGPKSQWSIMVAKELASCRAVLSAQGEGICNLLHVDNLIRYLKQVIGNPNPVAGFYNISDPGVTTWKIYYESFADKLGYPSTRITYSDSRPPTMEIRSIIEKFKQNVLFYSMMKLCLKSLDGQSKSLLKYYLPAAAGGRFVPAVPRDSPSIRYDVSFTHEIWSLHNTCRKLGSEKFMKTFGSLNLLTFEESLAITVSWLQFAGFAY